jgi:cation-transporting P-type ATPase F
MPLSTADREDVAHHGLPVAEVVLIAETDEAAGLTTTQWRDRLAALGPNELPAQRGQSWVVRLLGQLHHPLIYVLLVAAGITAALGEIVDASVVFGVVVVNAVIGFIQEARAERALDALTAMVRTEVTVVRDGLTSRVPSVELVPGDLVVLEAGDQVGADLRLVTTKELRVDESALTGESLPVAKSQVELPSDTALADRTNMA